MKLSYNKKSNDPVYYVQYGYRIGKKTSTKNIFRIGKHSELIADGHSDPLAYAKSVVDKYNKDYSENKVDLFINIDFNQTLLPSDNVYSKSTALNIGYFFLQDIYSKLNLKKYFAGISENKKITFDPNTINRFLTFDRILAPKSKYAALGSLENFFEKPSFEYQHILRFMDLLAENYDSYLSHLYNNSEKIVKRNTSICYYDCTNYYFEIETEDPDIVDEVTGEVFKGFRKYGVSKEHRPNPLIQMGLFMDKDGIPLSMGLFPGNNNEQNTVNELEGKLIKDLKNKKIIYCADAGLGSLDNRVLNSMGGRAFVVTQSIKKLSDEIKENVFSDKYYRLLSTGEPYTIQKMKDFDKNDKANFNLYSDLIYKVIEVDSPVDLGLYKTKTCKNGKTKNVKSKPVLKQRLVITFSRKSYEYHKKIRERQVERAENILLSNRVEKVKKGPNDVTRFIKNVVDADYVLDDEKISEEEKYDGFYAIATNIDFSNEGTVDDVLKNENEFVKDIISISSQRYKIEDCFRTLKTNFDARPVYHRLENRIIAHFMICYTALLIYRLLEVKLKEKGHKFTIDEILKTLKNMNVSNVEEILYKSEYTSSKVLNALNEVFDLELNKKGYEPSALNKKIKKIL